MSNGFMLPEQASEADMVDWLPTPAVDVDAVANPQDLAKRWNPETAVYILANVGDEFCELIEQVWLDDCVSSCWEIRNFL